MITILVFAVALLLGIIGFLLIVFDGVASIGSGILSGLTQKMGPGVYHEAKGPSRSPYFVFAAALVVLGWGILRMLS
jgi:hypothetical protein